MNAKSGAGISEIPAKVLKYTAQKNAPLIT